MIGATKTRESKQDGLRAEMGGEGMAIKTAQMLLEDFKNELIVTTWNSDVLEMKYGMKIDEIKQIAEESKAQFIREILVQPILNAVSESEQNIPQNILVDAIPLKTINAHAMRAENDEYLIIINDKLMALIHSYCEIQFIAVKKLKQSEIAA